MSMRLVTQNKEFDIPYDRVVVNISGRDNTEIIAYDTNDLDPDSLWIMGKYHNKDMAMAVMEQLRRAYREYICSLKRDGMLFLSDPFFEFPAADEVKM